MWVDRHESNISLQCVTKTSLGMVRVEVLDGGVGMEQL